MVTLAGDLREEGLESGAVGTIVEIHERPVHAHEVEFTDTDGVTLAVVALTADRLSPASDQHLNTVASRGAGPTRSMKVTSPLLDLLSGYFSVELLEERPGMRTSLHNGGPAGVKRVRTAFRDFLRDRPMTHVEFAKATMAWFPDDNAVYAAIEDAYRFFFSEVTPENE